MNSIKVNNLRSLVDVEKINLAPITVFVGRNSSGKSTMLRTFPLLKQSFEERTSSPLLWFGDYADFGDYETSLSKVKDGIEKKDMTIEFSFSICELLLVKTGFFDYNINEKEEISVKYKYNDRKYLSVEFGFLGHFIKIDLSKPAKVKVNNENIQFNEIRITNKDENKPELGVIVNSDETNYNADSLLSYSSEHAQYLTQWLFVSAKKEVFSNVKQDERLKEFLLRLLRLKSQEAFYSKVKNLETDFSEFTSVLLENKRKIIQLQNLILASSIVVLANSFFSELKLTLRDTYNIAGVRNTKGRYTRHRNLETTEVNPSGDNVPSILAAMQPEEAESFRHFTKKLFDFSFKAELNAKHISITLENDLESPENLEDVGAGYSQILPILLNLWLIREKKKNLSHKPLLCMEQPELHLHPALQGKLMDAFASKEVLEHMKILFETHSETMIGRIGHLIALGKLSPSDVNVYIFDKDKQGKTTIKLAEFNEKGKLKNWPMGFFSAEGLPC